MNQHLRKLAAVAVGVVLVAAGCGDDDDDSGAGATTTAASGATTTAASGATTTAAGGATTTAGAGTTAAAGTAIQFKPLDVGGPLTIAALENGDIQMGLLLSSDGTISQNGWVVLEDDKQLQPVENLVTVGSAEKLTDDYAEAIDGALSKLTTEELQALNLKMNVDKEAPADVAAGVARGERPAGRGAGPHRLDHDRLGRTSTSRSWSPRWSPRSSRPVA